MDQPHEMPWEKIKQGLSEEGQKLIAKTFQETWKDSGAAMRQSMDNRKYLSEIVAADEFDAKKFDEAVKRIRGVQDLMAEKKAKSTKELLAKLSVDDRRKIADQVANSFSWRSSHGAKRPHDHPRPEEGKVAPPPPAPAQQDNDDDQSP